MKHKTQTLILNGEKAEIDVELVPLIKLLNSIPGISTFTCCQGSAEHNESAYVMFLDCNERRILQLLTSVYRQMNKLWRVRGLECRRQFNKTGSHDGIPPFDFSLEMGNGWIMSWDERTYPQVFEAVKAVAERMKR